MAATQWGIENMARKSKRNKLIPFILLALLAACLMFLLTMPVFQVGQIDITGIHKATEDELIQLAGLGGGCNIFSFRGSTAEKAMETHPYVKSAKLTKHYPNQVSIEITERKPRAYVEFNNMNAYLMIDETGMVMEYTTFASEQMPVIVGLSFSDFVIGQPLQTDNNKAFEDVVRLSNMFAKYEMTDVIHVFISDEKDIHLYIHNVDVIFGSIENADLKIRIAKAAIEGLPEGSKGFLTIDSERGKAVFEHLK